MNISYDQLLRRQSDNELMKVFDIAINKGNGDFKQKILENTALIIEEISKREREKLQLEIKLNLIRDAFSKEVWPTKERRKIYSLMKGILEMQ